MYHTVTLMEPSLVRSLRWIVCETRYSFGYQQNLKEKKNLNNKFNTPLIIWITGLKWMSKCSQRRCFLAISLNPIFLDSFLICAVSFWSSNSIWGWSCWSTATQSSSRRRTSLRNSFKSNWTSQNLECNIYHIASTTPSRTLWSIKVKVAQKRFQRSIKSISRCFLPFFCLRQ